MDPQPIEEFRRILIKSTSPPLEAVTAMSIKSEFEASFKAKFDEHIKPFLDRIDKWDSSFEQISSDIKQLTNRVEKIGNDTRFDTLEKVEQEGIALHHMMEKVHLTASSVDRMDNKVDRFDTKIDRYDTKVDNLEIKIEGFNKQVQTYDERLDEVNQKMEELKTEIENLERDL
ncbi:hypothetical protein V866_007571 [Kwoniella sp. B9012]